MVKKQKELEKGIEKVSRNKVRGLLVRARKALAKVEAARILSSEDYPSWICKTLLKGVKPYNRYSIKELIKEMSGKENPPNLTYKEFEDLVEETESEISCNL